MYKMCTNARLLTVILLLTGIDKGYISSSRKLKFFYKTLFLIFALILTSLVIADNYYKTISILIYNVNICFEYWLVLLYHFTRYEQASRENIFNILNKIDECLNFRGKYYHMELVISVGVIINIAQKLSVMIILHSGNDENLLSLPLMCAIQVSLFAIELEAVWRLFLLLMVRKRLKCIKRRLKTLFPTPWFVDTDIYTSVTFRLEIERNTKLVNLYETYKLLADLTENITRNLQFTFSVRLCANTMKLLLLINRFRIMTKDAQYDITLLIFVFGFIFSSVQALLPCVLGEICRREENDVKDLLVQQALRTYGISEKELSDIHRFINIVSVRPICFKLFGVYAVDAGLLTDTVNICATYSIIMIQSLK